MLVRERSHTHSSRRQGSPGDDSPHLVTDRRYTSLRPTQPHPVASQVLTVDEHFRGAQADRPEADLWAATALVLLAIPAERALGQALHSPGLCRPPPWVCGSIRLQLHTQALQMLCGILLPETCPDPRPTKQSSRTRARVMAVNVEPAWLSLWYPRPLA